jgi:hypothetical protein
MTAEPMLNRRSVAIHEDDVAMTHGANAAFTRAFGAWLVQLGLRHGALPVVPRSG